MKVAMKTTQMARRLVLTSLLTSLVPIVLFLPQAYAETYVAGQFGVTFPQALSNGEVTQPPLPFQIVMVPLPAHSAVSTSE